MRILKLNELKNHDVYEFCSAQNYPNHWNRTSLFTSEEDFKFLQPYLDKVFLNYQYYGPQRVNIHEWEQVKSLLFSTENKNNMLCTFFNEIDLWFIEAQVEGYFGIMGI